LDLERLRATHGKLVRLQLAGVDYWFRPLSVEAARMLSACIQREPSVALELSIEACRSCYVGDDLTGLEAALDASPLAFDIESGVAAMLMQNASETAHAEAKAGVRAWRAAERNLALVAENLLAFKAYTGGVAGSKELAGALHVAETIEVIKATFKLHCAYAKAMAKRG
jgi:hypothetical protein